MSPVRISIVVLVVTTILFGTHYYLWARLIRDTHLPPPWSNLGVWLLVAMALLLVAGVASMRGPRDVAAPLSWGAFVWMGLVFFLLVLLGAVDAATVVARLLQWAVGAAPFDPERRAFLARAAAGAVGVGALGMAGIGLATVLRPVGVKRVRVPVARLPAGQPGWRIAQISDLHVGPTIGRDFVEKVVAEINALDADVVAITGDLVDGSVNELADLVAPLAKLRARHGVFFVTGNHEYYSGAEEWLRHLSSLGVRVLRNEWVSVGGADGLDIAGVNDPTAHGFGEAHADDVERALRGRDESRPVVLLAHQPRTVYEASRLGVDVQLSGHTHGGQLFPFGLLVRLTQPYLSGLHKHGDTHIYVSEGTGYWGPPMRVGTAAEITHLELVAS